MIVILPILAVSTTGNKAVLWNKIAFDGRLDVTNLLVGHLLPKILGDRVLLVVRRIKIVMSSVGLLSLLGRVFVDSNHICRNHILRGRDGVDVLLIRLHLGPEDVSVGEEVNCMVDVGGLLQHVEACYESNNASISPGIRL